MAKKHPYRPIELRRDHARPRTAPAPLAAAVEARITEVVQPATFALLAQYRQLGLRERVLTLPVMVCFLLSLIWRQIPSVSAAVGVLRRESMLWTPPTTVSQQAMSQRLNTLPPQLFHSLLDELLPTLAQRAQTRTRPAAPVITRLQPHFPRIWALDATTLEALFRKVGLLRGIPTTVLAGKLAAVLDLASKLPVALWWDQDATVNERSFLEAFMALVTTGTLVVLDKGFFGFALFDWFTDHDVSFVMPDRETTAYTVLTTLEDRPGVLDQVVQLGQYASNPCVHPVRRIVLQVGRTSRVYLTNVLDPARLAPLDVLDVYARRWRIEDAFLLVKRLLGLSYVWTGSANGIQLQVWMSWLLYSILVDLGDAVADELDLPLDRISVEMVFRGLYHFSVAAQRGVAADPVVYLATQPDLGIVKRRRKSRERQRLADRTLVLNL